jgi:F5/8 type C domain-containing protein/alpha-galactosidase-like protein
VIRSTTLATALLLVALTATGAGAQSSGPVTVTAEPSALEIRQCLADTVRLRLTNSSSRSAYVEMTIAADPPLRSSREALATVLPAGYAQTVPIRVTVPADAPAGEYALRFEPRRAGQFRPLSVTIVVPEARCIPREQMTATATSAQLSPDYGPQRAIDGDDSTIWHTRYSPTRDPLPQSITLAVGDAYDNLNGAITAYNVYVSRDGEQFTRAAGGTWTSNASLKTAALAAAGVRYVRLEATAGTGNYASAAEIVLFGERASPGG